MMKSGKSLLNPNAASFIPLSRRGRNDGNQTSVTTHRDHNGSDGTETFQQVNFENELPNTVTQKHIILENEQLCRSDDLHDLEHSTVQILGDGTEKQNPVEDFEVDMAYLAAAFPNVSEQSLTDVYFANQGDLEASIDMLIQLESQPDNFEHLPQTLNIGDVPDSGIVPANTSGGQATGSSEASGSSGPSDSALGTT